MNVSEIFCPVCKRKNKRDDVVCRHCGASLEDPLIDPGPQTKTTDMAALVPEGTRDWSVDEATIPGNGIAVYVEGAPQPAHVDTRAEFVIGRRVGATSEPLLDLAPSGGYHLGLSRRHAVIRRAEGGYELMDLGSVNGTWLNDERLVPHQPYPLASGSHLRLGRMRLFVLYRSTGEVR